MRRSSRSIRDSRMGSWWTARRPPAGRRSPASSPMRPTPAWTAATRESASRAKRSSLRVRLQADRLQGEYVSLDVRPAAILPVKSFDTAKQRLGEALGSGSRAALAAAMCSDVLAALERSRMLQAIVVVSGDRKVSDIVAGRDVLLIDDQVEKGQSHAARAGLARMASLGLDRAALVPSDCPLLDPAELEELFVPPAAGSDRGRAPDRLDAATNALVTDPAGPFEPQFGPGSRKRHTEQAERRG